MTQMALQYQDLSKRGWSCHETRASNDSELADAVLAISRDLGIVIKGRHGLYVERLESMEADKARAPSLSAHYGHGEFPYHVDTAHLPTPCRYIVLGCGSATEGTAPTLIQSVAEMEFSPEEMRSLHTGVFLVRNGCRSFYGSVLNDRRRFFRWDPGCMLAKDKYARVAQTAIERELEALDPIVHEWKSGSILVMDNWRVLHGRGDCCREEARRVILRSSVS